MQTAIIELTTEQNRNVLVFIPNIAYMLDATDGTTVIHFISTTEVLCVRESYKWIYEQIMGPSRYCDE